MIFLPISELKNEEKAHYIEYVELYTRLVEVFCEKNGYKFVHQWGADTVQEIIRIGAIRTETELLMVERLLGREKANRFFEAVSTAIKYKDELDGLLDKLSNEKRRELQRKARKKPYTLVDFFCGAGGLSLGFNREGFRTVLANDIEEVCIQTYKYNHPEVPSQQIIQGDIRQIVDNVEQYINSPIDVLVGGPPCQGFSEANRQRVIDDPRNKLYKYFLAAVEKIKPKFVVMENVKGMLKVAHQVVEDYANIKCLVDGEEVSYKVAYTLLNSVNFGVAQSRERLIYIAIRSDIAARLQLNPEDILIDILSVHSKPHILMEALEYIKPLQAQRVRNCNEIDSESSGKLIDVNPYEDTNAYLENINRGKKVEYVFNHKARYCSDLNYEIYKRLEQGDDATDEKIADIMPYAHRNHCFKDKYYKLYADRPCRTITAHLRMDCHSHIHPYQVRSLTPREAARVQSFPDDYLFLGAYLKTYMQIGNAVPPLMAQGIAKIIKNYLRKL